MQEFLFGIGLPMLFMLGIFYLIVFLPESRRKKKYNSMLSAVKVNDEIVTRGGIMGKIVSIQDDYIIVQTGPDRARIKLAKSSISNVTKEANVE